VLGCNIDDAMSGGERTVVEFLKEFWSFIRYRRNYWLLPICLVLLLLGMFIILTETSILAPFIYALF
jgi:hypothetical protein